MLNGANTSNLIQSDGHIAGLDLTAGALLIVRGYDGNPPPPLPIGVDQHLAMDATGTLRLVFDADPWDSTISFAPGIPVALGGTLELTFAPGVNVATQSGRTIDLFDWTGVTPTGTFTVSSPYTWNLTNLYTTGEVPSPHRRVYPATTTPTAPSTPPTTFHPGQDPTARGWIQRGGTHFGQTYGNGVSATTTNSAAVPSRRRWCHYCWRRLVGVWPLTAGEQIPSNSLTRDSGRFETDHDSQQVIRLMTRGSRENCGRTPHEIPGQSINCRWCNFCPPHPGPTNNI